MTINKPSQEVFPIHGINLCKRNDDEMDDGEIHGKTTQYTYDGNGSLTTDRNKGIAKMQYDLLGHPRRVQFRDGHVIEYVYAPDGTKLRTVWRTAVSGISVAYGQTHELTAAETLFRDSTDYVGRFLLKGSLVDRYLFDGGYLIRGNKSYAEKANPEIRDWLMKTISEKSVIRYFATATARVSRMTVIFTCPG